MSNIAEKPKYINKNKLEIGMKHSSYGLDWNKVWNK